LCAVNNKIEHLVVMLIGTKKLRSVELDTDRQMLSTLILRSKDTCLFL